MFTGPDQTPPLLLHLLHLLPVLHLLPLLLPWLVPLSLHARAGESAMGAYPDKAVGVLRSVALRMEEWLRQERFGGVVLPQIASTPDGRVSEEVRLARGFF